jgi:very-short-patch-repair endonuclease
MRKKPSNFKWTREAILEDSKKYKTKFEWLNANKGAYKAASLYGFFKEATAHMTPAVRVSKWNKDTVLLNAKKFNSIGDWRKDGNAYAVALKNGWLGEATSHMSKLKKGKWTLEELKQESKKYKTITEWSKLGNGSYGAASKNGWLAELTAHMPRAIKPNGYWTKERVFEDAKKYKTRSEWRKNSSSASTMATRNGWFEEATVHMELLVDHGKWTKKSVLEEAKKYKTKSEWGRTKNGSYGAALKNGWVEEASRHMVSADRTRKWTKELILEDAKKYLTRGEWHKAQGSAAHVAISKGWFEEATKHMYRTHSFGEMTLYRLLTQLDISFEAQKRFKTIKSKKPLPFDFYLPTFNLVIEYQGTQHYSESNRKHNESLADIQKRDELKRIGAKENKLHYLAIKETLEKDIERVLIEKLKDLSESKKIKCKFKKRSLTDEELALLKSLGTYTKEQVLADAKKYQTYPEWRKNSPIFQIAIKNGWLEECKAHMLSEFDTRSRAKLVWTKESVMKDALKYPNRSLWKSANSPAYSAARTRGWLNEATAHMTRLVKPNGYWTRERIFESAKKYKTRTEWMRSKESAAYNMAREKGWLEEACKHMPWLSTKTKK